MASKLQKALFSAIEHQYLAQVKKIVQAREKASLITDWQKLLEPKSLDTVLHAAVRVKHESILKYLLENCSSCLEQSNSSSMRPLHVATVQCHMYAVNLLLAAGAEVDAPSENHMTPLMLASGQQERDALHIVRMLLNSGANDAACNTDGWNSSHICCRSGSKKILEALVQADSRPVLAFTHAGESALHIAAGNGRSDLLPVLFKHGHSSCSSVCAAHGRSPLLHAVAGGHIRTAHVLLGIWSDARDQELDNRGRNALQLAVEAGDVKAVRFAADELKLDARHQDNNGETCVHIAAANGHWQLLPVLVRDLKCDVSVIDKQGRTALDVARIFHRAECEEILLNLNSRQ